MKRLTREQIIIIQDQLIDRYGGSHGIHDEKPHICRTNE